MKHSVTHKTTCRILFSLTVLMITSPLSAEASFTPAVNYPTGSGASTVKTADFNNDGIADMAVTNAVSNDVSILIGDGTGSFAAAINYAVGTKPVSVASADFNADGIADLAVANEGPYNGGSTPIYSNVSVLLGAGNGTFNPATNYAGGIAPNTVTTGDFNGDGNADMVVANYGWWYNNNQPYIVRNYPGGVSFFAGDGAGGFATVRNVFSGVNVHGITSADFNNDGNLDIAVATRLTGTQNNVTVLSGYGNGYFSSLTYTTNFNCWSVTSADYNNDGLPDLAVLNWNNDVSILLSAGSSGFYATPGHSLAGGADTNNSIMSADFNGDGNIDLGTANNGQISVHLGDGSGAFATGLNYSAGSSISSTDFNGDGNLDMAVANSASGNVSVLLNDQPAGTISINNGSTSTNNATVTLNLTCQDNTGCATMQFSNDNVTWGAITAYSSSTTHTLTSGNGSKTVYTRFSDAATNTSAVMSDTITLNEPASPPAAPPSPSAAGGCMIKSNSSFDPTILFILTLSAGLLLRNSKQS